MSLPGKTVKRTRLVRTERYVIAVEVDAVIPDADPSAACFAPQTVEMLRQVELHAKIGDVRWRKPHGKVYAAVEAA